MVVAGRDQVDLGAAVRTLRERFGLAHLLCEGGPTLLEGLMADGLVDELCLTVAPVVIGREGPRLVRHLPSRVPLTLHAVHEQDGELFLRYRVRRA